MALPTLSEFASQNPSDDPLDLYKRYSDFTKTELLKAGEWDDELVDSIDANLIGKAQVEGIDLGPDPFATLHNRATDEAKVRDLRQLEADADERKDPVATTAIRGYAGMLSPQVKQAYTDPVAYNTKLQQLEDAAAPYLSDTEAINRSRRRAVERGETPVAVVKRGDNMDVELSPALMSYVGDDQGLGMLLENHPEVPRDLIPAIRQKLAVPEGYKSPIMAFERQADFFSAAEKDYGAPAAEAAQAMSEGDFGKMDGIVNSALFGLRNNFGSQYTDNELRGYFSDMVKQRANPDLGGQNPLLELSTGQVVAPLNLAFDKEKFNAAIDAAQIPDVQKSRLREDRTAQLDTAAPSIFGVIAGYDPNFVPFKEKMVREGKSNAEILDTWNALPEQSNLNLAGEIALDVPIEAATLGFAPQGVASRIMSDGTPQRKSANTAYYSQLKAGVRDAIYGIPTSLFALSGSDTAKQIMYDHMKEDGARRAYSQLMGRNTGIGYDLLSVAPQLGADIAIAVGTGGAGAELAATRVTAKAALKLALKDMFGAEMKGLASSYMRNVAGDVTADQVYKLAARDMAAYLTPKLTEAAFLGTAFTRSAGSAYASISSALEAKGVPADQVRSTALGHALIAGTITAAITKGMSVFGHGGMETIFDDLSRPQLTRVFNKAKAEWDNLAPSVKEGIDMTSANKMLASIMTKAVKPILATAWKRGVGEAGEEGLDQFSQNINQSLATGEKVNLAKAAQEAGYAALLGGIMGGGIPAVRDTYHSVSGKEAPQVLQDAARTRLFTDTAAKLDKANSPQAAALMRSLANQAPATRSVPQDVSPAGSVAPSSGQAVAGAPAVDLPPNEAASVSQPEQVDYFNYVMGEPEPATPAAPMVKTREQLDAELQGIVSRYKARKGPAIQLEPIELQNPDRIYLEQLPLKNPDRILLEPMDLGDTVLYGRGLSAEGNRILLERIKLTRERGPQATPPAKPGEAQLLAAKPTLESIATQLGLPMNVEGRPPTLSEVRQNIQNRIDRVLADPQTTEMEKQSGTEGLMKMLGDTERLMLAAAKPSRAGTRSGLVASADQSQAAPTPTPTTSETQSQVPQAGAPAALEGQSTQPPAAGSPQEGAAQRSSQDQGVVATTSATGNTVEEIDITDALAEPPTPVEVAATAAAPEIALREDPETMSQAKQYLQSKGFNVDGLSETDAAFMLQQELNPRKSEKTRAKPGQIRSELEKHSFSRGMTAFLQSVAKSGEPRYRAMAKLLLAYPELLANTPVTLVDLPNSPYAGAFIPSTGQIVINEASKGPRGAVDTVIHELLHAATVRSLTSPTEAQRKFIARLDRLRETVSRRAAAEGITGMEYALSSNDEFITHWFTSPKFQENVGRLTQKGERNLGQVILDTIKSILTGKPVSQIDRSINSLMDEMLTFTQGALETTWGQSRMDQLLSQPEAYRNLSRMEELQAKENLTPEESAELQRLSEPKMQPAENNVDSEGGMQYGSARERATGRSDQQAGDRGGRGPGRTTSTGTLAPLAGAPKIEGATGPDIRLVEVAREYAKKNGIPFGRQKEYATVDPERAKRIAAAYEAMPHDPTNPAVAEAYRDLIDQTVAQYRALESAGYKFWLFDPETDPYASSPWAAMRDLRNNQSMGVFATIAGFGSGASDINVSDNPLMQDTGIRWPYGSPNGPLKQVLANDLFRAVHDAFGHGLEGSGFRAQGEENAWQSHVQLFTGPAVGAITSETRGQNSWLNFGPHGENNRTAKVEDTVFADQKTGLMPSWTWTEGRVGHDMDIRFQPAEDADYLAAVESGDMATAQRMVDAAAKAAGYDVGPVYHGSRTTGKIDRFDTRQGAYFTTDEDYAQSFRDIGKQLGAEDPQMYRVFLRLDNPQDFDGSNEDEFQRFTEERQPSSEISSLGFDGQVLRYDGEMDVRVNDPNQIKSADPVTYDQNGQVIPLSQRFNPATPDIRFQPAEPEETLRRADEAGRADLPASEDTQHLTDTLTLISSGLGERSIPDYRVNTERKSQLITYLKGVVRHLAAAPFDPETATTLDRAARFLAKAKDNFITRPMAPPLDMDEMGPRFQMAESAEDASYMAAVESGDMATAQRMVDAAAKAAGYNVGPLFHSRLSPFNQFEPYGKFMGASGVSGIHLTDSEPMAQRYLDRYNDYGWVGGKPNQKFQKEVIKVYAKITNPLEQDEPFKTNLMLGAPLPSSYVSPVEQMGYDALVRNEAISKGGSVKHTQAKNAIRGKEFILTNPNQIKSADPVTYDEQGNIIPLSQRFNPATPDIRFQPADPENLTNYLHAWDGYQFGSLDPNQPQPGLMGTLKRIFTQENDMRKPWREAMKAMFFTRSAAMKQADAASRPFAKEFEKAVKGGADADKLTQTIGEAIGTTAPMLTEDEALRIHDATDQRLLAAKANLDARLAAARTERAKVSRSEALRAEKLKKQKAKVRREGKKLINPTPEEQAAYDDLVAEQNAREAALMEARGKLMTLEDTMTRLTADHEVEVQQIMADDKTARIESELEFAKEARRVQDLAMQALTAAHPALAEAVGNMRTLLTAFQDEVSSRMGHRPELQMKIDRSRGIYLVRSYRLHQDPSLGQRILNDDKYQELRDRTITFFEQKFADQWVAKVKDAASKTEAQVTEEAGNLRLSAMEKELRKLATYASYPDSDLREVARHEVAEQARHAFEDFIIGRTNLRAEVPGLESIKVDAARFMQKGNVPKEIRDALLENTDPLFNATHTFNALANIVIQHDMLTRFRDAGLKQGWLTDADGVKSNPDRYRGWKPVVTANEGNAAWSNMAGMYAAPEDIEAFHSAFKTGSKRYDTTATRLIGSLNQKLTGFAGLSLGIVTQGNPAYYTRNVINGMFIMAANGLSPMATTKGLGKLKSTYKMESGSSSFDDMHALRSAALGLVQGGSVAADVQSLMEQYESDPVGAVNKLNGLIAERWPAAAAGLGKVGEINSKVLEKIGNLAAMSEGFAAHAIFDDKVKMLTAAKFGTPEEIFREAARRTLRVVPAKSERPQAITAFSQSGLGALVAPFIGFKSDVIRNTVNTFADAWADSKSDNPVIKAHGRKVLASASVVVVGMTSVLPMIAAALAGIGDDEDRAIRAALPEFAKNSSFIYWRDPKTPKQFTTFDLTFLNSYSFGMDPFTQGFTAIRRGRFNEIPEIVARTFGQEVFGENVVAGAVMDVKRNIDESTKRPIYLDSDTFRDKTFKSVKHVFDSAYNPALVKKAMQFQDSFSRTSKGGENFWYTPQGVLLGSIAPLKPRVNQVDDLNYRAMAKLRNAKSQLWQISAPLKSPAALSTGEARSIVDKQVEATRRIASEGYELVQGFRKLGMSDREIMQNMVDSGSSERSSKLLMQGYVMRPVLDKESLQKIYTLSPERYHAIIDEQNKHAVYLKVSP